MSSPIATARTGILLAGVLLAGLAPVATAQGTFSVPSPREARQAADAATVRLADGDLRGALDALEELLDGSGETLLPLGEGEATHWVGAGPFVRRTLQDGPPELRELFALRTAGAVAAELATATAAAPDEREAALLALVRRYPTTPGAVRARLALGDLAFAAGDGDRAREAWDAAEAAAALVPPAVGTDLGGDALAVALAARRAAADAERAAALPPLAPPPRVDGAWFLDLPPSPVDDLLDYLNLRPVARGQRAWVNTGLRVLGVDTTRGQLLWDSGEPRGWDALSSYARGELVEGVGLQDLVTSLDVGGGVVVAPLQLSLTRSENAYVEGLSITKALPERRLFAFDAETGAPLWDHGPDGPGEVLALRAGGNELPFAQRARVAAPPLVVGRRVLVPCYELAGRIKLSVAAYDLDTGDLLWRTAAISGQQRVNLFGEHEVEFNSAPLTVAGDTVLLLTQLGALVALDLETGEPRWARAYLQYELPKTRGYYTPDRRRSWHNTAPLVRDGVVLAAPVDSPELFAVDLGTGERRWTVANATLERLVSEAVRGGVTIDHPVAWGPEGLWVGGDVLAAFGGDLAQSAPADLAFPPVPTPGSLPGRGPLRPRGLTTATATELVAPTDEGLVAVERATGARRVLGPWPRDGELATLEYDPGSLALAPGRVLALDSWRLAGWLHWDTLIAEGRATLEARSTPLARLELAEMLLARAGVHREEAGLLPGFLEDPAAHLDEAGALLATFAGDGAAADLDRARLDRARFELLEASAARQADLGRLDGALAALEAARTATLGLPGSEGLEERARLACATLALLGAPDDDTAARRAAREGALDLLAEDLATEPVPEAMTRADVARLAPGLLGPGGLHLATFGDDPDRAWRSLARRLPLGLLARLARADLPAGPGAALDALHRALWDFGPLEVAEGLTLAPLVEARIAELLASAEGADAYGPFEDDAAETLRVVLALPAADRTDRLAALIRRYPHSRAAAEAEVELLEAQLARFRQTGEGLDDLTAACHRGLAAGGPGAARAALALAWALAEGGNPALARAWLERLLEDPASLGTDAATVADLAPDFAGGLDAAGLLGSLPAPPTEGAGLAPSAPAFGPVLGTSGASGAVRLGSFRSLGRLVVGDEELLLVSSNNAELYAFAAGGAGEIRWTFPVGSYSSLPWDRRLASLPERLVVASSRGLVALDPASGHYRWEASRPGHRPLEVTGDDGLVLVEWLGPAGRLLEAFDAVGGASLWTLDVEPEDGRTSRVLGARLLVEGDRAVVLDRDDEGPARVVDLLRGAVVGDLDLAGHGQERDRDAAWLTDGRFVLPHFFAARAFAASGQRPNAVEVWELDRVAPGAPLPASFAIELGASSELVAVAHADGMHLLWLVGRDRADRLVELVPGLGALREVATLGDLERPLGFELGGAVTLPGDLVLTLAVPGPGAGRAPMTLRALGLPLGPLWSLELEQPDDRSWSLYDGPMPAPALSTSSLALVYALSGEHASMGQQVRLLLVDRRDGAVTQDRVLTSRLGRVDDIHLVGHGPELYVFGRGGSSGRGRLEVLGSDER